MRLAVVGLGRMGENIVTRLTRAGHQCVVYDKNPAPVLEVRSVTATQVSLDLLIWSERPEKASSIVGDISLALDSTLRQRGFAV